MNRLVRVLTGDMKKVQKEDVIFTYGVDSCVAVLIKLKNESKICIHFGFDNSVNISFDYKKFINRMGDTIDKGFIVYIDNCTQLDKRSNLISYFQTNQNYKRIEMTPKSEGVKKEYDSLYCNDKNETFGKMTKDLIDTLEKDYGFSKDYENYFNNDGEINNKVDFHTDCNEGQCKAIV